MHQQADAESTGSRIRLFKRLENFNGWGGRSRAIPGGLRLLSGKRPRMPSGTGAVDLVTQCLLIRWLKAEDTSKKHSATFRLLPNSLHPGLDRPSMAGRFPTTG